MIDRTQLLHVLEIIQEDETKEIVDALIKYVNDWSVEILSSKNHESYIEAIKILKCAEIEENNVKWDVLVSKIEKHDKYSIEAVALWWNKVEEFPRCNKITLQMRENLKYKMDKLNMNYTDVWTAINSYIKYIRNNDRYTHRFTLYEFISQKNWMQKYVNM